jgi:transcriptional regulator with XRE-family HTH domain
MSTNRNAPRIVSPSDDPEGFKALVGARVREAREDLGWSRRELARRVDLSYTAVAYIERGIYAPNALNLARIAEATGQEPGWFFGEGWPR